jgi:acetylglutamate kinase
MDALRTATPYLSRFRGQIFVIKIGGEVVEAPHSLTQVVEQIALLWHLGVKIVVVHGGGTAIDDLSARLGLEVRKVAGRRVTDEAQLEAVKMTLAGKVHTDILAAFRSVNLPVVGLSGLDAGLIVAQKRPPVSIEGEKVDFGQVGDIHAVDAKILHDLLGAGYLPIVTPLTLSAAGEVLNTNADTVASHLATALTAEKLIFVIRVLGLLRDVDDPSSLIPAITKAEIEAAHKENWIAGGMKPKLAAALHAIEGGVPAVHLVGGFAPDSLLVEIFTNEGSGTMIHTP